MTLPPEFFRDEMSLSDFRAIPNEERAKVYAPKGANTWERHCVRLSGGNGVRGYTIDHAIFLALIPVSIIVLTGLSIQFSLDLFLVCILFILTGAVFGLYLSIAGTVWIKSAGYRIDLWAWKAYRITGHRATE